MILGLCVGAELEEFDEVFVEENPEAGGAKEFVKFPKTREKRGSPTPAINPNTEARHIRRISLVVAYRKSWKKVTDAFVGALTCDFGFICE